MYKKGVYVDRPKLKSYKKKESGWTAKFHKLYPNAKTMKQISKAVKIPVKALQEVIKKGKGAYYSSGSRPNQTPDSWAYARLASVIMNGPSRKYDMKIWNKYHIHFCRYSSVVFSDTFPVYYNVI